MNDIDAALRTATAFLAARFVCYSDATDLLAEFRHRIKDRRDKGLFATLPTAWEDRPDLVEKWREKHPIYGPLKRRVINIGLTRHHDVKELLQDNVKCSVFEFEFDLGGPKRAK